ncbi:MAG: hypothetical protein ACR5LF_11945 [Symbiopectobacterium sp.]
MPHAAPSWSQRGGIQRSTILSIDGFIGLQQGIGSSGSFQMSFPLPPKYGVVNAVASLIENEPQVLKAIGALPEINASAITGNCM